MKSKFEMQKRFRPNGQPSWVIRELTDEHMGLYSIIEDHSYERDAYKRLLELRREERYMKSKAKGGEA